MNTDIDSAVARVMNHEELNPMDKTCLYIILRNSNELYQCHLQQQQLARLCGVSLRTLSTALKSLESRNFILLSQNPKYFVAWPYCEDYKPSLPDKSGNGKRLYIRNEQAKYLQSLCREREQDLTILAQRAEERKEKTEHRRIVSLIDYNMDIADILDKFIERTNVPE